MFKVAVVGNGCIARSHFDAIKALDEAQLVAVVARDAERGEKAASAYGAKFFTSLQAAKQATDMDAVIVCTPTNLHEQHVTEAAKLGCHVLCEKPAALEIDAFERMLAVCRENGVALMLAQVVRFIPEYAAIRDWVVSGRLGDIHMVYEKRLSKHPDWTNWHRDPAISGGSLYDINVHDIDFVYHMFGRPETVYANGWKSASGCWNHVCTSFVWKSGARAVVETSLEMTGEWPFSYELRVTGDKGTIVFDNAVAGGLRWYPEGGKPEQIPVSGEDMFVLQAKEFFASLREERESSVDNAGVKCVLEMIEASRRSLENNIVVKL